MKKLLVLVLCLVLCVTSCDIFKKPQESQYAVEVDQNIYNLFVGEECNASASAFCDGAVVDSPVLQWESSNEAVATVENGNIKALA